jgi:hypothetical protein
LRFAVRDWLALIPPTAAVAGLTYISYRAFCPHGRPQPSGRVNTKILTDNPKVVDMIDIEDISEKAAFCRCWKTKNVSVSVFVDLNYLKCDAVALLRRLPRRPQQRDRRQPRPGGGEKEVRVG